MSEYLTLESLHTAIDHWLTSGKRVAGPRRVPIGPAFTAQGAEHPPVSAGAALDAEASAATQVRFGWLENAAQLLSDGFVRPVNSIKEFFLPQRDVLFHFQGHGKQVKLLPRELPADERVIVAARPCDAAALPILDEVFNWDYADALYNRRRELTTVVTLGCTEYDEHCFCTSVGLGPAAERGADAVLLPLAEGGFEARFVTPRGEQLLKPWTAAAESAAPTPAGPPLRFDLGGVQEFLEHGYESPLWATAALSCLGCGACAHNCPACHCFDIVDQTAGGRGQRVRNWDSCQSALYSLHASGHNPRNRQADRQRNRLFHKYRTYPQKFGHVLCTGCGACSRNCPVDLGVRGMLEQIESTLAVTSSGERA